MMNAQKIKSILLPLALLPSFVESLAITLPTQSFTPAKQPQIAAVANAPQSSMLGSTDEGANALPLGDNIIPLSIMPTLLYCIVIIRRRRRNHIELNNENQTEGKINH